MLMLVFIFNLKSHHIIIVMFYYNNYNRLEKVWRIILFNNDEELLNNDQETIGCRDLNYIEMLIARNKGKCLNVKIIYFKKFPS